MQHWIGYRTTRHNGSIVAKEYIRALRMWHVLDRVEKVDRHSSEFRLYTVCGVEIVHNLGIGLVEPPEEMLCRDCRTVLVSR